MMATPDGQGLSRSFEVEVEGGVAAVVFDAPGEPVNTLSPEVGAAFEKLLQELERDPAVQAVVFLSGKPDGFVAGAKIELLQQLGSAAEGEALARGAQQVFDRLARCAKPVVAAIHGACLGGGLEWALACRYRIATDHPKTQLGQPELQLGLIPGAGGTQRLPRLVGLEAALDLILTGRSVNARRALRIGLVDEVVPPPLLRQVARQRAAELAAGLRQPSSGVGSHRRGGLRRLALEQNPIGRELVLRKARSQVIAKGGGHYPAPERALEAIRVGLTAGLEKGLELEARRFGELAITPAARRLIELFFAQTALKKENGTSDASVRPRPVARLGVLGGGLMGGGIAYASANAGLSVRVREKDVSGAGRALGHVRRLLDERVRRRSIDRLERDEKLRLVTAGTDWAGFEHLDLVIEAVFEDLGLKQEMVRAFEAVNARGIFASNTSSLPIARIAEASKRPEAVLGMHYFSPVEKMRLLEVVVTPATSPEVIATAVAVGKRQGKTVIVVKDGPGFYTTRILVPYMNEAARLMAEGGAIEEIDAALVEFGFPVGPVMLLDEIGIDVGAKVAKVCHQGFGERMAVPEALDRVLAAGRSGRKNQKGFYTYGHGPKAVDPTVYDLLPGGRERKAIDRKVIVARVLSAMLNEAIRCLGEGILGSPRDGDLGAVFGIGFPPFRGGPFRHVDTETPAALLATLEALRKEQGERFEPAPLLVDQVRAGKRFHEQPPRD
jgi:3-hydroxyacyl-CoA dehydrogenase/enoyl-CoA hydratase/3-hydroxybutyryl-CoA epimerase